MPKATLQFSLPDEAVEYRYAIDGAAWKDIVYAMTMFLRDKLKYGHTFKDINDALESTNKELWDHCSAHHLSPWED